MKTGYCRYCGEPIYWISTKAGRMMPVDTTPYKVVKGAGAGRFVSPSGEVFAALKCDPCENGALVAYMPHFATCREYRR